ncbi:MAG: acyltransferase [Gemmatimonadaceae bacterium]|nr:acyltransferase [Gemmatimonadaceae bacterium]
MAASSIATGTTSAPQGSPAPAPSARGQRHIPALDGVRGVAILLVFTYHALRGLPVVRWHEELINRAANAGWVGVDLFFVLSGFLITGILLEAKGGTRYFRSFYTRRVLRIFPLYFACVALVIWLVPALHLATPADAATLRSEQWWYWTYLVNVMVARHDWPSAVWNTGHLWSLSIEEQFYLLWPAVVLVLDDRALLRTAAALVLGATLLRGALVIAHASATAIYVLLPTRMDSLAAGAGLAVLARAPGAWAALRRWAPAAGTVAALALAAIIYREGMLYSERRLTQLAGYPALVALAAVTIVSATSAPAGSVRAWFWSHPVLRFFGRYSYGLYVWHHLAIPLLRTYVLPDAALPAFHGSHLPGYALFYLLALAVSLGVALASWHLLEHPFLSLKRFVPYQ